MLKRYILFVFETHDCLGGWNDLHRDGEIISWSSLEEVREVQKKAMEHSSSVFKPESQIVDLHTGKVIDEANST